MTDKGVKKKIKVVLVDDHTLVREALVRLIDAEKDIQVVATSGDGDETAELIEKHKPDVVVLDIELPKRSGLSVAAELMEKNPKQKLILLTMHRHEEYALRGLRLGVQGYLLKSSDLSELLDAIRRVSDGGSFITREISDRIARHVARNGGNHAYEQLSDREFQVLRGLAQGKSCKELADEFNLSVKTIYTYRTRLLEKLELKNDIDILLYVQRHELMPADETPSPQS